MVAMISIDEYGEMIRNAAGMDGTDTRAGTEKAKDMGRGAWNEAEKKRLDEIFLGIAEKKCGGKEVSCVYLIGDGYKDGWASRSLRYLCRGRRVFQGNNLYSKGACYGIREKIGLEEKKEYVFLGLDKLKAVHLNDSMNPMGSHKDRHAPIGKGTLGLSAICALINHPRLKNLFFILETPHDTLEGYGQEIAMLRECHREG